MYDNFFMHISKGYVSLLSVKEPWKPIDYVHHYECALYLTKHQARQQQFEADVTILGGLYAIACLN